MKNFILYIVIILNINLFGQKPVRNVETRCSFLSPTRLTYFKMPALVQVTFSSYNLGTDTIFPEDTFLYQLEYNGNYRPTKYMKVNKMIIPGDSIILNDSMTINVTNPDKGWFGVTISTAYYFSNDKYTHGKLWSDRTNSNDNKITIFYTYTSAKNNINEINYDLISLYPNPTLNELNLLNKLNKKVQFQIYQINGKLELSSYTPAYSESEIDIASLSSGVYFIYISDGIKTQRIKFIKL
jgi:hypothetical protein